MKTEKITGLLLILGAVAVFVPYIVLTNSFNYPDILRQDAGIILTRFHKGGSPLIFTWWAFAILGLPLLIAYIKIGQQLENRLGFVRWATTFGVISGIVQIIGLLRWTFVVPNMATKYVKEKDPLVKEIIKNSFETLHQFGGILLGEHVGQLFTIIWTIMISIAFIKLKYFPKWVGLSGIGSAIIYAMAQAELFATVIPGFPMWEMAGFTGSTLWLVWLIITGVFFIRRKPYELSKQHH